MPILEDISLVWLVAGVVVTVIGCLLTRKKVQHQQPAKGRRYMLYQPTEPRPNEDGLYSVAEVLAYLNHEAYMKKF